MKAPAFQFYADDFIGGTVMLTAEDVGAYMRLLCFQWGHGSLPERKALVDRIAGCEVSNEVMSKFPCGKNARMEIERQKQEAFRANRSESGKAGADKRWHSHSTAIVLPLANGMANDSSPSPSPSPSPLPTPTPFQPEDSPPAALSPKAAKVRVKAKTETDDEWVAGLEKKDCYRMIVIRDELGLARAWCEPRHRQCTRLFFTNWLGRAVERVRTISTNGTDLHSKKSEKHGW